MFRLFFLAPILFSLSCSSESLPQKSGFISLSPAITETIFYLNAQDQLIGRSDYCFDPMEAKQLPSFGTAFTPNWEALSAQAPKAILADQSIGSQNEAIKQIAPTYELAWLEEKDIEESIEKMGEILEKETEAKQLLLQFQEVFQKPKQLDERKILILMLGSDISKGQIWYIRKDSLHGQALQATGFQNAAPEMLSTPSMSIEQLLQINPDIILLLGPDSITTETSQQSIAQLKQLSQLQAVKNQQIARIEMKNAMGIGPGILNLPAKIKETIALLPIVKNND